MTRRGLWGGRVLALLGIVLVALSLRTPVAALSPILDRIGADIRLDAVVLAIIGAAPPLAFAASALIAPATARRLGLEGALLAALAAMVIGHLGRAVAPEAVSLTIATGLALVGVGVGNVILPPVVRKYFPDRVGLITSLYVTLMSVSTALPALLAVPLADAVGWRSSLGMWLFVSLVAAVPWTLMLIRGPVAPPETREAAPRTGAVELSAVALGDVDIVDIPASATVEKPAPRSRAAPTQRLGARMLRSPTAWAIGVISGSGSLGAYACFAWLPQLLVDQTAMDAATAGALLSVYAFMGFPAGLVVPVLAARFPRSAAPIALLGTAFFVVGYLGLLLAPGAAPALWVVSAGLGPILFPLAMVLINVRTRSPEATVALSGFVQTIGYLLGAAGPFAVGLLHDVSGGWTVPLLFLLAAVVIILPAAAVLLRGRTVDEEL